MNGIIAARRLAHNRDTSVTPGHSSVVGGREGSAHSRPVRDGSPASIRHN
jgi:hypothetical protein